MIFKNTHPFDESADVHIVYKVGAKVECRNLIDKTSFKMPFKTQRKKNLLKLSKKIKNALQGTSDILANERFGNIKVMTKPYNLKSFPKLYEHKV